MAAAAPKKTGGFMKKLIAKQDAQKEYLSKIMGEERTTYIGDPAIDWSMGGFKRGAANLFYGPSKSGKSTLCLILAGLEQKRTGGYVVIYDSEYAHDLTKDPEVVERWIACGLDPEKVIAISSNEVDILFADIGDLEADLKAGRDAIIAGKKPDEIPNYLHIAAIVIDSWGGIQSEQAKDKLNAGNISGAANQYGGNAKTINPIIQTILRISATYGITSLHVQHCIENMDKDPRTGAYRGPKWILLGGQKLRYLSQSITFIESVESKDSLINEFGQAYKEAGGIIVGKKIRIRCEKSRKQVEGRKAETWMNFRDCKFAKQNLSLFNLASSIGVIYHPLVAAKVNGKEKKDKDGNPIMKVSNTWWAFKGEGEERKFQITAMLAELESNKDFFNEVWQATLASNKTDAVGVAMGSEEGIGGAGEESEDDLTEVNASMIN